jgi:hypothetical protein
MAGCYSDWDVHCFASIHNDGNFTEYYQPLFWNNTTWITGIHNLIVFTLSEYQSSAKLFKIYSFTLEHKISKSLPQNQNRWAFDSVDGLSIFTPRHSSKTYQFWYKMLQVLYVQKQNIWGSDNMWSRTRVHHIQWHMTWDSDNISSSIWIHHTQTSKPWIYKILHLFYVGTLLPEWFHSPDDYNVKEKNVPQSES